MNKNCSIEQKDSGVFLANEQKTKWVTLITFVTMVGEIIAGYWTGSMALLADGWHMASHTLALGLSLLVYYLYRHPRFRSSFTFGGGKILSLGGYTSALFLVLIALSMIVESVSRFYERPAIRYEEALIVAVVGLVVNLICALILHNGDHSHSHSPAKPHEHGANCNHNKLAPAGAHSHSHSHSHADVKDHNHESAYVHILTDALTSLFAIVALVLGIWQGWGILDPVVGVLGGLMVLKWSFALIANSGKDLLDAHDVSVDQDKLVLRLEEDGSKVMDIHLWRLSPNQVGCELVIRSNAQQKSADYRDLIKQHFAIHHLVIEVV